MRTNHALRATVALVALAAIACGGACTRTTDGPGGDAGRDAGTSVADAGRDAGSTRDGGPDASLVDAGTDASLFPPWPNRCPDEAIPGFKPLDGGWFRPCNCFDGDPLRPVPTREDEGLRTVPFDCAWPPATIYHRSYGAIPPAEIDSVGCGYTQLEARGAGFYPAPFVEDFFAVQEHLPDGIPADRLCVPTECVFDTPGEPAHCNDACAPIAPSTFPMTIYRVDRTACELGDGGIPDAG